MTKEEAIEYLKRADTTVGKKIKTRTAEALDKAVKALEQELKTGHWINIDATHSKCDRCWAVFEITSPNGEINYCPNCGTKMKVEGEVQGV